jgi:hypothetical protein
MSSVRVTLVAVEKLRYMLLVCPYLCLCYTRTYEETSKMLYLKYNFVWC